MNIHVFLFNDFETLDAFGPVEVLGKIPEYKIRYVSQNGGVVTSAQGAKLLTEPVEEAGSIEVLLVPGGRGTRILVYDTDFLAVLKRVANMSCFCLSVCTGSALLAVCGVLDGMQATSNKRALDWVKSQSEQVKWLDHARWVVDDKFYTSSGVSAGIDMALGFIADRYNKEKALETARAIEYIWNSDSKNDCFSKQG